MHGQRGERIMFERMDVKINAQIRFNCYDVAFAAYYRILLNLVRFDTSL